MFYIWDEDEIIAVLAILDITFSHLGFILLLLVVVLVVVTTTIQNLCMC